MAHAHQIAQRPDQQRVVLAPLAPDYAGPLYAQMNDWGVVGMLAEVQWPLELEHVKEFLASEPSASADNFAFLVGGAAIGVGGVKKPGTGDPPRQMPRLGYWIGREHWGHGYGTEAVGRLVTHAFAVHPHDRVGAGAFKDNTASQRVLAKLGFRVMGAKEAHSRSRGGSVPTVEMQITRDEWRARARP